MKEITPTAAKALRTMTRNPALAAYLRWAADDVGTDGGTVRLYGILKAALLTLGVPEAEATRAAETAYPALSDAEDWPLDGQIWLKAALFDLL